VLWVSHRTDSFISFALSSRFSMYNKQPLSLTLSINNKYRTDYNFNPPRGVDFIPVIPSTSGRLHSEFIRILFSQTHLETDRFFLTWGVLSTQSDRGFFHYHHTSFSSILKSRVGNILDKDVVYLVLVFRCTSSTTNPVYTRRVDSSFLVFSLLSHRYSYISLLFTSRFIHSY
jgi:hypothetical protein